MYKLLTEGGKERVKHEYNLRRAVAMLAALSVVLVVGIVSLLPSYVLSSVRQKEAEDQSMATASTLPQDSGGYEEWLHETNRALALFSPQLDSDRPFEMFNRFLSPRPASIAITSLSWIKTGDKTKLVVRGVAQDRKTLIDFQTRLEESEDFTEVVLPISNLAKDREINFQITLTPQTP